MSLRLRLSLLIAVLFVLVLFMAGYVVVENARKAIQDEIHSSARLTLQLIEIAFASVEAADEARKIQLIEGITNLEASRHLTVSLIRHTNTRYAPVMAFTELEVDAPSWYVSLVKPEPIEFRRNFPSGNLPLELVIRANPSDEITEAWNESRGVFIVLILFLVVSIFLVYFTLGKGLKPIGKIIHGLEAIEQGNYQTRLPAFSLPELSSISEKFNHMAEVMQKSREENRALTQKSLAIQEQERQQLAYALHDELGQSITAVKAVAASINNPHQTQDQIASSVNAILEVSNRMYDVARNMMRRLRPTILDELGIVPALQEMIDDWNSYHDDRFCNFSCTGQLDKLGENININIYRIVQESLTNVVKHSTADTVHIELKAVEVSGQIKKIHLLIKDNGQGFDLQDTVSGMGLLGMRERAESLDGDFSINTSPGNGVRLELTIQLKT